jgi:hypothetical protein
VLSEDSDADTRLAATVGLLGSPTFEHGLQRLSYLEPAALSAAGVQRYDLLPIAVSLVDLDLVVIQRRAAAEPDTVIWFAGAEVDRYPTGRRACQALFVWGAPRG